jgi:TonB-linked SusC/RagA family outer membrane protein
VRRIGFAAVDRTVSVTAGAEARLDVALQQAASRLDQVVVTALGRVTEQRVLGTAQQSVSGLEVAQTQRENFVNALQGRIAGVNVTSTSGVPGASSSITIRGVSSISGSNQPLFIVDGLPVDNKTLNTSALASDAPGSPTAFNNRGLDFTNRAADINPEDIESITVLKGAEAAALYGIDAGNGAIVITTKRGRAGQGGFVYNNNFRVENTRTRPEVQRTYGVSGVSGTGQGNGSGTFLYFGPRYADTTTFYDNVDGFFRTGGTQQHNLSFNGAAADNRVNYRLSGGLFRSAAVVRNADYNRVNLTGSSQGQVTSWLRTDLTMSYTNSTNDQPFKGFSGPLLGLLAWPSTDDAKDYLTASGTRRRLTTLASNFEIDNPYLSVDRNNTSSRNNRFITNLGLTFTPVTWASLNTRIGSDSYTNQLQVVRNPESALGAQFNGILDEADDITRNVNVQNVLEVNSRPIGRGFSLAGLVGNQINDIRNTTNGLFGRDFLDPNFVSINNTNVRSSRTTLTQRRLIGLYGQAVLDYNRYLFVTVTGRNDWTSTIPIGRNSFFYPSVASSFVFSDAFPRLRNVMTGKLRGSYAAVGKDARPYAYRPALEFKTTSNGGYGYGFTGPNLNLSPEFKKSYEFGTELSFLQDRLGLDATYYRATTQDQIVNDIRGSYATGFILFNLNGATTRNAGLELTLRGAPVRRQGFTWDVLANFDRRRGRVLSLPNALPESYVSDTWLYGNVRNGVAPGVSTESLTGQFYLRATGGPSKGQLLIDPASGLPVRSTTFIDAGYNRTPGYTVGLTNTLRYRAVGLSFLLDMRRGGDVFNATQHYLTTRGLSTTTLDRDRPRVIAGVLRDGRENSAAPTANSIVVVPSAQTNYYTDMSEELFIERNINWLRLADVRLTYNLPARFGRSANVFVQGTDLLLLTNYTGLDPVVNGNSAAVGGSGAAGIDFGNFARPRGINFGITTGF